MSGKGADNGVVPPHNIELEHNVLGAILLDNSIVDDIRPILVSSDFYSPANAAVYEVLCDLWEEGISLDIATVVERLRQLGRLDAVGGSSTLVSMIAGVPTIKHAVDYAKMLVELSQARQMLDACAALTAKLCTPSAKPADAVDEFLKRTKSIADLGVVDQPDGLMPLKQFLEQPVEIDAPWVVPGLVRKKWRIIVVAVEGSGKSTLLRQIAIAASQGVHPFMRYSIDPVRALLVDLENPIEAIDSMCSPIFDASKAIAGSLISDDRIWIWHKPDGLDLRSRRGRSELEAALAQVRPDLVCMGPVYKLYRLKGEQSHETAVAELQNILDDMRVRYGFALMLEHHAPKGESKRTRELDPYGTVLWRWWPEIGLGLQPVRVDDFSLLRVGRFRGDRLKNEWPDYLRRGSDMWPWDAVWQTGRSGEFDDEMSARSFNDTELF